MDTPVDEIIDAIYDDYLEEAQQVKTKANTLPWFNPYRAAAVIGAILMLGGFFLGWGAYFLCGGMFMIVVSVALVFITANPRAIKEAEIIAQSKPGFSEFYRLYSKGKYWPYQIIPGEKYDQFLSIIGKKGQSG